ncbi:uncharacterized protein LOC143695373 [Agelaius phoeniceus]|uniref:uncharacterized protein LOC143695373 n=1 Tax=Agelaius phoeniceus TaxID=39638 RepID=UPI004054F13F
MARVTGLRTTTISFVSRDMLKMRRGASLVTKSTVTRVRREGMAEDKDCPSQEPAIKAGSRRVPGRTEQGGGRTVHPVPALTRFGEPVTQANVSSDGMEGMPWHRPGSGVPTGRAGARGAAAESPGERAGPSRDPLGYSKRRLGKTPGVRPGDSPRRPPARRNRSGPAGSIERPRNAEPSPHRQRERRERRGDGQRGGECPRCGGTGDGQGVPGAGGGRCRSPPPSPVPLQPAVVVPVEEVGLGAQGAHLGVHPDELQHGAGAALLDAHHDGPRQALGARAGGPRGAAGRRGGGRPPARPRLLQKFLGGGGAGGRAAGAGRGGAAAAAQEAVAQVRAGQRQREEDEDPPCQPPGRSRSHGRGPPARRPTRHGSMGPRRRARRAPARRPGPGAAAPASPAATRRRGRAARGGRARPGPPAPAAPPRPSPPSGGGGSALPPREVPGQRRLRRYLRGRLTSAPPGAPAAARRPVPPPGRAGPGRGCRRAQPLGPGPVPLRSSRPRSRCPARPCPALPPHPALNRSKQRSGAGAAASVPAAAHPPPGSGEQRRSGLSSPRRQRQPGLGAAGVTAGPGVPQPGARAALPEQSGPEGSAAGPPHGSSRFCPREGRRSSHRPPPCRRKLGAAKRTFWHFGVGQWSRGMH